LSQRLVDKDGWALLLSTPRGKNWFFDLFRRGQGHDPDYQSWNAPSWTNPHLNQDLIEQERDRLPERVFRQEYGGEFEEGSGQVFRNVRECATGEWQEPAYKTHYYAGLDLARVADWTVLVVINAKKEVVFVDRFQKCDWTTQINRIKVAIMRFNKCEVIVDSTGAGEPIYEALLQEDLYVQPYTFTNRSKAALIDNLALMFEKKEITLPKPQLYPELIEELEAFQYSVTDSGSVRSGAPSSYHDDCVIALALAAWHRRPDNIGGFTIEVYR